jgi:hypothetical protein
MSRFRSLHRKYSDVETIDAGASAYMPLGSNMGLPGVFWKTLLARCLWFGSAADLAGVVGRSMASLLAKCKRRVFTTRLILC